MVEKNQRGLIFINNLRAVATVMVFLWHLGVLFWFSNETVSSLCHIDILSNINECTPLYISKYCKIAE